MVFHSRIDWWVWVMIVGTLAVIWYAAFDMDNWLFGTIMGCGMTVLFIFLIFGFRYVIDGDNLVVYQFFRPTRFPISKIKDVKKTTGYLATAGMSHLRVSISFADRSVLKSFAPLEISPRDRDGFIERLIEINPDIKEIK